MKGGLIVLIVVVVVGPDHRGPINGFSQRLGDRTERH